MKVSTIEFSETEGRKVARILWFDPKTGEIGIEHEVVE